jgi:hypothetical protein
MYTLNWLEWAINAVVVGRKSHLSVDYTEMCSQWHVHFRCRLVRWRVEPVHRQRILHTMLRVGLSVIVSH